MTLISSRLDLLVCPACRMLRYFNKDKKRGPAASESLRAIWNEENGWSSAVIAVRDPACHVDHMSSNFHVHLLPCHLHCKDNCAHVHEAIIHMCSEMPHGVRWKGSWLAAEAWDLQGCWDLPDQEGQEQWNEFLGGTVCQRSDPGYHAWLGWVPCLPTSMLTLQWSTTSITTATIYATTTSAAAAATTTTTTMHLLPLLPRDTCMDSPTHQFLLRLLLHARRNGSH